MQELQVQNRTGTRRDSGFQMLPEDISGCIKQLEATLRPSTVARYRKALLAFYDFLPADKRVYKDTLPAWLESMTDSFSNAYINTVTSACNAFMKYMGHEDYWLGYIVKQEPSEKVVTREDYLRLLTQAKRMRQPMAYLAMRTFVRTGADKEEFLALTVEAVQSGDITAGKQTVHLPDSLREELLDYALQRGVSSGKIFVNSAGEQVSAAALKRSMTRVSKAAGFEARVVTAHTLRRLFETTQGDMKANTADVSLKRLDTVWKASDDPGVVITREDIDGYLSTLRAKGRTEAPKRYAAILGQLYQDLPEDKCICSGTLDQWIELLREKGYAQNTLNLYSVTVNRFFDYIGHRECHVSPVPKVMDTSQPELTRSEYLQLLQAAKALGREREYLLVKLFASCDLPVQELDKVTVEAARAGGVTVSSNGVRKMLHLPRSLCQELLAYAERQNIGSGTVFATNRSRSIGRAALGAAIARLGEYAGVSREKCNPQCLRRLYQTTRSAVEASFAVLVEQAMDRQLEQENIAAGWEG